MKRPSVCLVAATLFVMATSVALEAQVSVPFLSKPPVVDGALDEDLRSLPVQQFSAMDSDGTAAPVRPTYRIAYGAGFLYLYIEVNSAEVITRDRAYQNGDGFHVAITRPMPNDAPTNEFYVMGFGASAQAQQRQRKFVWYRNVDLAFTPLESAVIESRTENGKTGIELLLPWSEVYPFHPWLSDAIGFNLCYVKATGERERTYYYVIRDDRFQSEQSPRKYVRLRFEPPVLAGGTQAYAILDRNHMEQGGQASVQAAIVSAKPAEVPIVARVLSGEGTRLKSVRQSLGVPAGLTITSLELPVSGLPEGGYTVTADTPAGSAGLRLGLSLLPPYDTHALSARLEASKDRLKHGSFQTLQFQLQQIESEAARLKSYDTAAPLRFMLADFLGALTAAEQGRDLIAVRTGTVRRAYRSQIDDTLQPYSVRIPSSLAPGRKYPLIVYLHGSGEDDREQLREGFMPDTFLQLAPNGRGTSNFYSTDHAQDDIREAISAVLDNYPVDPDRIILSGFSMGGYGVYRTFTETPQRFRALAIFSGDPSLGRASVGEVAPDFLDSASLAPFGNVPMFIFHGGRDRNCPIEHTQAMVEKLKAAGARVDFHYEPDKGHESPSAETQKAFHDWLQSLSDNRKL